MIRLINFNKPGTILNTNNNKQINITSNRPMEDCFIKSSSISFKGDNFDMDEVNSLLHKAKNIEKEGAEKALTQYEKAYDDITDAIINNRPLINNHNFNKEDLFKSLNITTLAMGDCLSTLDKTDVAKILAENTVELIKEHYKGRENKIILNEAIETLNKYNENQEPEDEVVEEAENEENQNEWEFLPTAPEEPKSFEEIEQTDTQINVNDIEEDIIEENQKVFAEKHKRYAKAVNTSLPRLERFKEIELLEKEKEYSILHHIALSNTDELSNNCAITSLGVNRDNRIAREMLQSIAKFHQNEIYRAKAQQELDKQRT